MPKSQDTLQWLKKAKKRERELAKRTQVFENIDNVVQGEYTERWSPFFFLVIRQRLMICLQEILLVSRSTMTSTR